MLSVAKNISRLRMANATLEAAVGITSQAKKGFDGGSNTEFIRFLRYSQRSASEVQSQLYVALDQNYIDQDTFDQIYERAGSVKSKVGGFISYLLKSQK